MVELHETLRDFEIWREVAQVTENELRRYGWTYTIVFRAMREADKTLQTPRFNTVQLVSRTDNRFEFAFNVNKVLPPHPHNSIKDFVEVQILQVIDEYITNADEL
jgi:hypothetical protein